MTPHLLLAQGGLKGIADGQGVAISITGMLIVFAALAGISLFIGLLPMVLARIEPYFPETEGHHHGGAPRVRVLPEDDDLPLIAAIGYAKHAQARAAGGSK